MESKERVLIVENECEIIKPKIIKKGFNKKLTFDATDRINKLNKSILENKNNYPIFEILTILNNPIETIYKKRNFPKNRNFDKELENDFKNAKDINAKISKKEINESSNMIFLNISKLFEINNNLSLKKKYKYKENEI